MSQPKVKVYNPVGRTLYTSLTAARRDVKRGRASWREVDALIEYRAVTEFAPTCRFHRRLNAPPTQSVELKIAPVDAATCDSNMAQTFLTYPQRSLESYGPAYPALALDNAGLG